MTKKEGPVEGGRGGGGREGGRRERGEAVGVNSK